MGNTYTVCIKRALLLSEAYMYVIGKEEILLFQNSASLSNMDVIPK